VEGRPRTVDGCSGSRYSSSFPAAARSGSQHPRRGDPATSLTGSPRNILGSSPPNPSTHRPARPRKADTTMNDNTTLDEATLARQALQESMDLRDQGHSDD